METPIFTIAIPLHGKCLYTDAAFQSALHQQDDRFRVLLVRDDDEDDSELLSLARDHEVIYVRNPDRGISANWNMCLDTAAGTLCTIFHQDDLLAPTYIRAIRRLYQMFPDASAYFVGARVIGPSGRPRFSLPDAFKCLLMPRQEPLVLAGEHALVSLLRGNWLFCPAVCYNLTRHFSWRFCPGYQMVLDLDMYVQILVSTGMIIGTHEKHYHYRRHDSQYTARLERDHARFEEEITYYRSVAERLKHSNYQSAAKTATRRWVLRGHTVLKSLFFMTRGEIRGGLSLVKRAFS